MTRSPKTKLEVTAAINRADPAIDPHWSDILLAVRLKAKQIDEVRAILDALIAECDDLVLEAVDDGERYRDIAKAAERSFPWVQTALRRKGAEGPRVRLMTTRAADAKRADDAERAAATAERDLFPDGLEGLE